jgi:hypothetical protein
MTSLTKHLLSQEKARRNEGAAGGKLAKLFSVLSPKQISFIQDSHRWKVAVAGRRGGKSFAIAAYCIAECIKAPNTPVLYLGLTRDSAKAAVWDILLGMLEGLDIQHEARPSALAITFPNGSSIILFGGDTPNARNRLRGRKFKLIAADETGFFAGLDPLIKALLPTLADYRGTLIMASSPGETLNGFFYDAYEGEAKAEWKQWHWTLLDNPHFMRPSTDLARWTTAGEEELETICRVQFGGNREHPAFVREYLGQYRMDDSNLVYPYGPYNLISAVEPLPKVRYGLGIDLGSVSSNAIVVVQFSEFSRVATIVDLWKEAGVSVDALAAQVSGFMDKYKPDIIVADTGGYGKGIVDEIRRRYHLPIKAAEKTDKAFHQRIVANDLRSSYIKCLKDLPIVAEWGKILKDEFGDEIKGQENHASDAFLYVYRYVYTTYLKHQEQPESDDQRMLRQLTESALKEKAEREDDERSGFY